MHEGREPVVQISSTTSPTIEPISEAERLLLLRFTPSELCDLKADGLACPFPTVDPARDLIRATFLRQILLSVADKAGNLARFDLRGATITGVLDVKGAILKLSLEFVGCVFTDGIDFESCRSTNLTFRRCAIPRLTLDHARLEGKLMIFNGTEVVAGGISADRIAVEGALFLQRCTIRGPTGVPAARVGNHFTADDSTFSADDDALILLGAEIKGWLSLKNAKLTSNSKSSMVAEGLKISLWLSCVRAGFRGAVLLRGADVGALNFDEVVIKGHDDYGVSLDLTGMQCKLHALFRRGFAAREGMLRIAHANIIRNLDITSAKLSSDIWPALLLEQAQVGADLFIRGWKEGDQIRPGRIRGGIGAAGLEVRGSMIVEGVASHGP
jgi:hypothetical protein